MRNKYILDTSVLIADPQSFKSFKNSDVILPLVVLEELDKLKKMPGSAGKNARVSIKLLENISASAPDMSAGLLLDDDIFLSISFAGDDQKEAYGDNRILACARFLRKEYPADNIILVSNDINLRWRARVFGLMAEGYETKNNRETDLYSGIRYIKDEVAAQDLLASGNIFPPTYGHQFHPNECIVFQDKDGNDLVKGRQIGKGNVKVVKKMYPWALSPRNKEQEFAIDLVMDTKVPLVTMVGKAGSGKAQPLGAKILTPNGWTTMGQVEIGDLVSTPDGKFAQVIGTFPQGELDIYKVSFSDGTATECCGEHLWLTKTVRERDGHKNGSIKTTLEIKRSLFYGKDNKRNHSIPITKPIELKQQPHIIDPYAFGLLLGDGSFRHQLKFTSADQFLINKLGELLKSVNMQLIEASKPYDYLIRGLDRIKNYQPIIAHKTDSICKIYNGIDEVIQDNFSIHKIYKALSAKKEAYGYNWEYGEKTTTSPLINYLRNQNLWMRKSEEKHIPDDYKYSSVPDRIALLQGLMDTDGSIDEMGSHCEFSTSSPYLAEDFRWLVESLGGTTYIKSRDTFYTKEGIRKPGLLSYRISLKLPNDINPFLLPRKRDLVNTRIKYFPIRFITDVQLIGKKEAKCILINSQDHLYITNNCIVTHNTLTSLATALELVLEKREYNKLIIYRPIQAVGQDIGFLPGTMEEKLEPWFQAIMDNLETLFASQNGDKWRANFEAVRRKEKIQMEALTYIRGRSIPNAIILIDEAQNIDREDIKTILTRVGEGTKILLNGDVEQIDRNDLDTANNGLSYVIEKFRDSELSGHITFSKGERSKLATQAASIL
jgi:predicted ribonuclease YlaK